jgi:radical SAM superfamily enzyme YgiQ (UPF0313 family)
MKVLLVNCPVRERAPPYTLPLGMAYLIAVLRKAGHKVEVLDINGYRYDRNDVEDKIKGLNYDMVCTGGVITIYKYLKFLTAALKKYHPGKPVVVGGNIANEIPELLFSHTSADILMIGEAETTICELADALGKNTPLKNVDGLAYRENGGIVYTSPRKIIENIDSIPFPEWDLFPVETYIENLREYEKNYRVMPMLLTRGCPFVCRFCYHSFMNEKARFRSADNIVAEMRQMKEKYGINGIAFYDDLLLLNRKVVEEMCDKMIEQKLNLKWHCLTRLEYLYEDLILKMKKAGCFSISYGLESGSQTILNNMKKGIKLDEAKATFKRIKRLGLKSAGTFMIGYPGENMKTIRETVDFCKELGLPANFFFATPFPGTPLWEEWKHKIRNEDEYVEKLGDVQNLVVNMTDFSDEELIKLRDEIEKELRMYCYARPWILARLVKDYFMQWGFKKTVKSCLRRVKGFVTFTDAEDPNIVKTRTPSVKKAEAVQV